MEDASETQDLCLEAAFLPVSFWCHWWKGQWEQAVAVLMFPKLVSAVLSGCQGLASFLTAASPRGYRWERA